MVVMKITIEDNRYIILEATSKDLDELEKVFTFKDMSACYVNGKFKKENIVIRKLLIRDSKNKNIGLLPIGFIQDVKQWLTDKDAKYKIFDQRKQYSFNFTENQIANCLGYLVLDDFQVHAVRACFENENGIIKVPTGGGKCVTGDTEIEIEYNDEEIKL